RTTTVNGPCNGVSPRANSPVIRQGRFQPDRTTVSRISTIRRKDGGRHSFYHKNKLKKISHQPLSVQNSEASPMEKEHFHRDAIDGDFITSSLIRTLNTIHFCSRETGYRPSIKSVASLFL
ncbi:hypothetical protein PMAYCL1PPCAC_27319, partial [Pristionchus mayeri]